jgi:hypothetical protein
MKAQPTRSANRPASPGWAARCHRSPDPNSKGQSCPRLACPPPPPWAAAQTRRWQVGLRPGQDAHPPAPRALQPRRNHRLRLVVVKREPDPAPGRIGEAPDVLLGNRVEGDLGVKARCEQYDHRACVGIGEALVKTGLQGALQRAPVRECHRPGEACLPHRQPRLDARVGPRSEQEVAVRRHATASKAYFRSDELVQRCGVPQQVGSVGLGRIEQRVPLAGAGQTGSHDALPLGSIEIAGHATRTCPRAPVGGVKPE